MNATFKLVLGTLSLLTLLSFKAGEVKYNAMAEQSTIHWLGKKTTGQHEGNVNLKSGTLALNGKDFVSGEFVIDMTTITCTDIKEAEDAQHLVDHLKNEDFFNTASFPESLIRIKKMVPGPAAATTYTATADLTIKGIKNEIQFPVKLETNGTGATATADIVIDRTKWNVVYKSKTVFSTLGDKFIYDDMYLTVKIALQP